MRIKLECHGFPADGLCSKPALLPRFLMYAKLFEWHWFQVTPGCILMKCYYLLKAAILQDWAMHQLRSSVIATEPPCENLSSTEPLNKRNHDQDVANESTHSWTPEIPKMIQLSQALWEVEPGLTQLYRLELFPWTPCCSFCCSPVWVTDTWDPSRLSALIKKLHIPPGYRGKLRKVCSIRTGNKGRQTKGGLGFGIGHSGSNSSQIWSLK